MKIDLVSVTLPKDLDKLLNNSNWLKKFLPISKIIVIGPEEIQNKLPQDRVFTFINENHYSDFNRIKELICQRTGKISGRTGWYVQQFIKMAYSISCEQEYYLIWDSDTIPVKPVAMFLGNKPYFDCKTEYHRPYFDTLKKLFPGLDKNNNMSFISEHMLVKTEYMKALIHDIEMNEDIPGENFQEKIIYSIAPEEISGSGFSEFETYGTYVTAKYPDQYVMREWHSMRDGGCFFDETLSDEDVNWLRRYYDAVSLEKWSERSIFAKVVQTHLYKRLFSPKSLEYLKQYRTRRRGKLG